MTYERELETAFEIVRDAGALALQFFNQPTPAEEKQDSSPVTIADRECEKLISQSLSEYFPGDGILGEEGTSIPSRSGRRWLIDPIDGTRDFVRRNSYWAIQLALQIQERVVLGIIYCPCMKELLYAVQGQGCYWNGSRVTASDVNRMDKSILMVSGFKAAWDSWPAEAVRRLTQDCWTVRCYGGCYDVIMLARGKADIWLSGSGMEWDYAPVQIIAGECGARFLTREGDDRIDAKHCVVFAPGIEQEIRKILGISNGI
jgi:histidinol-phosphatase